MTNYELKKRREEALSVFAKSINVDTYEYICLERLYDEGFRNGMEHTKSCITDYLTGIYCFSH